MLTDASGQIISLESLLQKQVTVNSTPTLRLTGSKPGQTTNLIQLAGTPGSPITQYAVVSQGRNLISMAQPRVITTQATGIATSNATTATINSSGQLVAVSGVKTTGGISVLSSTATSTAPKTDFVKIGGNATAYSKLITMTSVPTSATTSATVAASTAPQNVMRYKTGGTSFRIMNASNLNIAHIGGKPVIIASKTPNSTIIGPSNVVTSDYKSQPISTNISPRFTSSRINTRTIVNSSAATTTPTRTVVLSSTGQTIKVHSPTLISAPSSTVDSGGGAKVTVAASGLPSTQQVVLGPSNIKVNTNSIGNNHYQRKPFLIENPFNLTTECHQRHESNDIARSACRTCGSRRRPNSLASEFPRWFNQYQVIAGIENDSNSTVASVTNSTK